VTGDLVLERLDLAHDALRGGVEDLALLGETQRPRRALQQPDPEPGFQPGELRYVNNSGVDSADPVQVILPHFFNHQTHHRAQVHTLLSQLGRDPPVLDLHRVLRP